MSDFIEQYKEQQRQRRRSTALWTTIIMIGIVGLIAVSVMHDKKQQRDLYAFGGAVGVVNKSSHQVTVHLFMHDGTTVIDSAHSFAPGDKWVIRDSMSKREVADFPKRGWIDSAHFVFGSSLLLRQADDIDPWYKAYEKHYIGIQECWQYELVTVRPFRRYHPALYCPRRVYTISDEDYNRAVLAN